MPTDRKSSKSWLAWAGAAAALAVGLSGCAVSAAMGLLWFEHPAVRPAAASKSQPVKQIPSRLPTSVPLFTPTPTATAIPSATPAPRSSTTPKSSGGTSGGHSSGGGSATTTPPSTTIVVPIPTITIPAAPPPPPYTDADVIADVERESPDAKYGLVTGSCDYLNSGEWSRGSSPPWPLTSKIISGGVLAFTAHADGTDGFVQYYGCY